MRVALVNNFPPYSGTGKVAYETFRNLRKTFSEGENVFDLYCTHFLEDRDLLLPENQGVKFIQSFAYKRNENLSRVLLYFLDPFLIPKKYDLYHITNHMLASYLNHLKPCVITVHDLLQFKYEENRGNSIQSNIYNFLLRRSLNTIPKADKIIAVSDWTRREILKKYNLSDDKIVTIYNGVDHCFYSPGDKRLARRNLNLDPDSKVILHVGAETKRKNIPTLLTAFTELLRETPNLTLVRIGEKKEETEKLINNFGIEGSVRYFENIPEERVVNFYRAADVLVQPSLDEGFGFPVLEAMACGLPVVISDVGPLPEIGGMAARYFNPTDTGKLAIEVENILNLELSDYAKLSGLCFSESQRFSWEKTVSETLLVYKSVLEDKKWQNK